MSTNSKKGPTVSQLNAWLVKIKDLETSELAANFNVAKHAGALRDFWPYGPAGDRAFTECLANQKGWNTFKAEKFLVYAATVAVFPDVDSWIRHGGVTQLKHLLPLSPREREKTLNRAKETGKTLYTAAQDVGVIEKRAYKKREPAPVNITPITKQEKIKMTHAATLAKFIYDHLSYLPELDNDMTALVGTYVPAILSVRRTTKRAA